jgi:hypothetical protein
VAARYSRLGFPGTIRAGGLLQVVAALELRPEDVVVDVGSGYGQ